MGAAKSNIALPVTEHSILENWDEIGGNPQRRLFQHRLTGHQAVMQQICLSQYSSFQEQAMKYEFRRQQRHNLVAVYYVEQANVYSGCSTKTELNVLVENILHRLTELAGLSSAEGLYILLNSMTGFKAIQQMNGVMELDDRLIGFNIEGQVRVWLNHNLALNSPELKRIFPAAISPKEARSNQILMVDRIIRMVWEHVRPGDQETFMKAYQATCLTRSSRGLSFFEAINFIEEYIDEHEVYRLKRIIELDKRALLRRIEETAPLIDYASSKIPPMVRQISRTPIDTTAHSESSSNHTPSHQHMSASSREIQQPATPLIRPPQASNPVIHISSGSHKRQLDFLGDTNIKNTLVKGRSQGLRVTSRQTSRPTTTVAAQLGSLAQCSTTRTPKVYGGMSEQNGEPTRLLSVSERTKPFSNETLPPPERSFKACDVTPKSACFVRIDDLPSPIYLGSRVLGYSPVPNPSNYASAHRHQEYKRGSVSAQQNNV